MTRFQKIAAGSRKAKTVLRSVFSNHAWRGVNNQVINSLFRRFWVIVCFTASGPYAIPFISGNRQDSKRWRAFSSISVPSRGTLSPQLLSTEDTLSVGKGGVQQRWHSGVAPESTVLGTRLLATSCPPVTSCRWGETNLPHHSLPHANSSGTLESPDQRGWSGPLRSNTCGSEKGSGYRLPLSVFLSLSN